MSVPVLTGFGPEGGPDPAVAARVARAWLAGGLVGLPTETVYGLAADAQDPDAVGRIYRVKGRPTGHPLIVHVQGVPALAGWSGGPVDAAELLARHFWPGPLTIVVPRSGRAGDWITGGQPTVALRCPAHPVALACIAALAALSGDPARGVAAPSANRFGRVSPTSAADVVHELGARLDPRRDLVVDGGRAAVGVESTIVDCTAGTPRVLRLGAISQAQVDAVLAGASGAGRATAGGPGRPGPHGSGESPPAPPERSEVRAPGTLDSHYAPTARVLAVEPEAWAGLVAGTARRSGPTAQEGPPTGAGPLRGLVADAAIATPPGWLRVAAPRSVEEYAFALYAALRAADLAGVDEVVAVLPDPHAGPLAAAVRDRLARAAHPQRAHGA